VLSLLISGPKAAAEVAGAGIRGECLILMAGCTANGGIGAGGGAIQYGIGTMDITGWGIRGIMGTGAAQYAHGGGYAPYGGGYGAPGYDSWGGTAGIGPQGTGR